MHKVQYYKIVFHDEDKNPAKEAQQQITEINQAAKLALTSGRIARAHFTLHNVRRLMDSPSKEKLPLIPHNSCEAEH